MTQQFHHPLIKKGTYGYDEHYFDQIGHNLDCALNESVLDPKHIAFPEEGVQLILLEAELIKQIDELNVQLENNQKCLDTIHHFIRLPVINLAVESIAEIITQQRIMYESNVKQIQQKINDKQKVLTDMQSKLEYVKKTYKNDYYDTLHFDGYEKTKKSDLKDMTLRQIMYLVYKYYGVCNFMERLCVVGDGGIMRCNDETLKSRLIHYSLNVHDVGCSYCKEIFHKNKNCPLLAKKYCTTCQTNGHDVKTCTTTKRIQYHEQELRKLKH